MSNENEVFILTNEDLSKLSKTFADLVDWREKVKGWKGTALEALEVPLYKGGLSLTNKLVSPYVPMSLRDEIRVIILDVTDGDGNYSKTVDKLEDIGQELALKLPDGTPAWVLPTIQSILKTVEGLALMLLEQHEEDTQEG